MECHRIDSTPLPCQALLSLILFVTVIVLYINEGQAYLVRVEERDEGNIQRSLEWIVNRQGCGLSDNRSSCPGCAVLQVMHEGTGVGHCWVAQAQPPELRGRISRDREGS